MKPRTLGTLLLVAGLVLLAHPAYLWPHYGQTPYSVDASAVDAGEVPDDATVVDLESLPPGARHAVEASIAGGSHELYSEDDAEAIEALQDARYVRTDGTVYALSTSHADGAWLFVGPVRVLLTVVGATVAAFGALVRRHRTARPLTPRRSLLLLGATVLALVGTTVHDVGGVPPGLGVYLALGLALVAFPLACGVVVGSAMEPGDGGVSRTALAASVLGGLVVVAALVSAARFAPWVLAVPTALGAAGTAAGYLLRFRGN